MKVDIVTFGSATRDLFLEVDGKVLHTKDFITGSGICFPLGSKVKVDEIFFTTGGGGTNSAATFAKQGFKTVYLGRIGHDWAGREILEELEMLGVDTSYIKKTSEANTNFSIVLNVEDKDRTILVYRGASSEVQKKDLPSDLSADWYYFAPFAASSLDTFYYILENAQAKIAANPSKAQLKDSKFAQAMAKIDILVVNQEEASILTGVPYAEEKKIFEKIDRMYQGIFIMTKGPEGLIASDDKIIYQAKAPDSVVVDRTGAGDSFSAGFVSEFIRSKNVEASIQLGIANATACLKEKGAKNGLLHKKDFYQKITVEKRQK